MAGAYSKAKGAEVNVSSCCKQIFPLFSLLMKGTVWSSLTMQFIYPVECWWKVWVRSWEPSCAECYWGMCTLCFPTLQHLGAGRQFFHLNPIEQLSVPPKLQDYWDFCQVHISLVGHPISDPRQGLWLMRLNSWRCKFVFKYFYEIKFQEDFKSRALNPHFKDKILITQNREEILKSLTSAMGQQGRTSPWISAA